MAVSQESAVVGSEALHFVAEIVRNMSTTVGFAIAAREFTAATVELPCFSEETRQLREEKWTVAALPQGLLDRRAELLVPASDAKRMEAGMRSGASVMIADMDDSQFPTWDSVTQAHLNICNAVRAVQEIHGEGAKPGLASIAVRPRGIHIFERNMLVDGALVSAALFDVGVFAFNNAREMLNLGLVPNIYIPKIENHLEASLWNNVLCCIENELCLPAGSIKATVMIESVTAAFEIDEILYELRDRAVGIGFGKWDYLQSFIRYFGTARGFIMQDVSDTKGSLLFLDACESLLVRTAHSRGLPAIGGTSNFVQPLPGSDQDVISMARLLHEKAREVVLGYDGSRLYDPAHVEAVKGLFSANGTNRIPGGPCHGEKETASEMLALPSPRITMQSLRRIIVSVLRFLASWASGRDYVTIDGRIENISTVDFYRSLLWQWARAKTITSDGTVLYGGRISCLIDEETAGILKGVGGTKMTERYEQAAYMLKNIINTTDFTPSLVGYALEHSLLEA